jgi:VRR-NUC domain
VQHVEHQHQKALITWAARTVLPAAADVKPGSTVADYLLAIPNGGARSAREGARLKAEGVKPGVSDLLLPLRRQGFAGLWLEMKAPGEKPNPRQREWLERMTLAGYLSEWRDNWLDAAGVIARYVGISDPSAARIPPAQQRRAA